ncbi:ribonuclease H-like domain-containing protein [Tanacetum coccineum]
MKARATLLMALPNKDQMKFHTYQDAKLLMEAIEKRYGGNKESKKAQKTLLKQQYENFSALSSESMDQTFDRLQKLISQLEIKGEIIEQEDMNLKLLRSLPSEWKTRALIWRNKPEIETISLDDLYNHLKIYEPEFSGSLSIKNPSDAMICAFLANQPNAPQLAQEDLEQIDPDDLEKIDLQWEMAMLTIRARRFYKRTGRKMNVNGQRVIFDKTKIECYNCHKHGHFARECRAPRNQENRGRENDRRTVTVKTPTENTLPLVCQMELEEIGKAEKERDELKLTLEKFQNSSKYLNNLLESQVSVKFKTGIGYNLTSSTVASPAVESFVNSSKMLENQENNKSKYDKGYHVVPPPYTGNFIPFKPDLTFMDEIVESENMDVISIVTPSNVKTVESNHESAGVKSNGDAVEPKTVRKNRFRPLVIED